MKQKELGAMKAGLGSSGPVTSSVSTISFPLIQEGLEDRKEEPVSSGEHSE
jgi:hypothetical protein